MKWFVIVTQVVQRGCDSWPLASQMKQIQFVCCSSVCESSCKKKKKHNGTVLSQTYWVSCLFIGWPCVRSATSTCTFWTATDIQFIYYLLLFLKSISQLFQRKKNSLYCSVWGICQFYQPLSSNFLVPSFHFWQHASYFGRCLPLCFISIVKQINSNPDLLPLVFHYEERRPDTNHNRSLKFPAHSAVCARNTNRLTTRAAVNKCKL